MSANVQKEPSGKKLVTGAVASLSAPVRVGLLQLAFTLLAASALTAHSQGVQGDFGLAAMVHTPSWPNNADVAPWDGKSNGEFIYRAIPCSGNAPMNNISSNLPTYNSLIPGSRSPASTRSHPFKFQSNNGKLTGAINLTVCKLGSGPTNDNRPDAERDRILINFQANSAKRTPEENVFSGTFTIAGGTGRYAKLKGEGTIRGYFMCFDPKGCAEGNQGMFRDMQYVLEGTFNDPAFAK